MPEGGSALLSIPIPIRLQELEMELEHQKGEWRQLLEDLKEKQQEILHFREEQPSLQKKGSR